MEGAVDGMSESFVINRKRIAMRVPVTVIRMAKT